jgi:hypothetical protein
VAASHLLAELAGVGEETVTTVVLRSGRVLQYNNATWIDVESGMLSLRYSKGNVGTDLIARISLDVIERVEYERPCKQWKQPILRRLRSRP